jgi:hypothetical protein
MSKDFSVVWAEKSIIITKSLKKEIYCQWSRSQLKLPRNVRRPLRG